MDKSNIATAKGLDLPISTKASIEVCNFIKHKSLQRAKRYLDLVLEKKAAIPLTQYNQNRGHRVGKMGPGFFPQKTTKEIIRILNSAEANAKNKGLNVEILIIKNIIVNKASRPMKTGRIRGQKKRSHIEIFLCEKEAKIVKKIKKESKGKE